MVLKLVRSTRKLESNDDVLQRTRELDQLLLKAFRKRAQRLNLENNAKQHTRRDLPSSIDRTAG